MKNRLSIEELKSGILLGERGILSKAITLVESRLLQDQKVAEELLEQIMPYTGKSLRIAITGVPGSGKSTLIESLGKNLTNRGKRVAVLAVDPSSTKSKGSILGDKTRMEELSRDPLAFIRPSPSGDSITGITQRTRQSLLLCEAAGFEIILVETVGVGQIETMVHNMVDLFLLVMLTGAGDELQMIKKGVMELADVIVVNKADGSNKDKALHTKSDLEMNLHDFPETAPGWKTKVEITSSLDNLGIAELWSAVENYFSNSRTSNYYNKNRERQNVVWMNEAIGEYLENDFNSSQSVNELFDELQNKVAKGELSSTHAARLLFEKYKNNKE